jgi:hypothetical protein
LIPAAAFQNRSNARLDGISLREAIEANNNDPGRHAVTFAGVLRGKRIALRRDLPPA